MPTRQILHWIKVESSNGTTPQGSSPEGEDDLGEHCKYWHVGQAIAKAYPWNKQTMPTQFREEIERVWNKMHCTSLKDVDLLLEASQYQSKTISSENKSHFVKMLSFASSFFFFSMRKITWLNSQQPNTRGHVEHRNLPRSQSLTVRQLIDSRWQGTPNPNEPPPPPKKKQHKQTNHILAYLGHILVLKISI